LRWNKGGRCFANEDFSDGTTVAIVPEQQRTVAPLNNPGAGVSFLRIRNRARAKAAIRSGHLLLRRGKEPSAEFVDHRPVEVNGSLQGIEPGKKLKPVAEIFEKRPVTLL
jgi:hypothetical protein